MLTKQALIKETLNMLMSIKGGRFKLLQGLHHK